MTTRGERTRERIIETAEMLFGERGLDAVSLREINVAAGQRNTAALHYHFSDRLGLIMAIVDKHRPRVGARQQVLLDQVVASGRTEDVRGLVDALLRPEAEYLDLGPSERSWIKILALLLPRPQLSAEEFKAQATGAGREIRSQLEMGLATWMEAGLAAERVLTMNTLAVHVLADRARLLDDGVDVRRPVMPTSVFTENLIDIMCGALTAPVSALVADGMTAAGTLAAGSSIV